MSCGVLTKKGEACKNPAGKCRHHEGSELLVPVAGGSLPPFLREEDLKRLMTKPLADTRHQGIRNFKEQVVEKMREPGFRPYQKKEKGGLLSRAVDGLISTQAGMWNAGVKGAREGATLRFKEYLHSDTGESPITGLYVARKPIISGVKAVLNGLSLGGFSRTQKKLDYDQVYHSFLIVITADGKVSRIERNHVVEQFDVKPDDDSWRSEAYAIPLPSDRVLTVRQLIETASKDDSSFWHYDARGNNCQRLVLDVIRDNGLETGITDERTKEVIEPQDAKALVDSLGVLSGVPLATTDLASRLDRLRYGDGIGSGQIRSGQSGRLSVNDLFDSLNSVGRG
jgi:hypothetical protein